MLQIFCTQSLPVLQNDQKIFYNIAPLSIAWLIPACYILSHRKQLYLQVSSQWGYIKLKHDSGESNKTVGNGIFHNGRLVSLCYWAQQSKAAERVLDTQFQPFQTMHVYYFLVMVYSFLGRGLLNDCFMVMKSIICIHIIICRHTLGQESTAHSLE